MRSQRDIRLRELAAMAAGVYVVWTPLYFLTKPDHDDHYPSGRRVEMVLPTARYDDSGHKIERLLAYRQRGETEDSLGTVYEGRVPLSPDRYEFAPFNSENRWRIVTVRPGERGQAGRNGRYFVVWP